MCVVAISNHTNSDAALYGMGSQKQAVMSVTPTTHTAENYRAALCHPDCTVCAEHQCWLWKFQQNMLISKATGEKDSCYQNRGI